MALLTYPKFQVPNLSGTNLSGGMVYFYEVGTSTPKDTYSDAALTVPNANPVILDSRGEADIYVDGAYKIILKDSKDVEIWTIADYRYGMPSTTEWPTVVATKAAAAALPLTSADAGRVIHITSDDGGKFVVKYNATPGTYADNGGSYCGTQFIPTGGDGTIGIVRDDASVLDVKFFGVDETGATETHTEMQTVIDLSISTKIPMWTSRDTTIQTGAALTIATAGASRKEFRWHANGCVLTPNFIGYCVDISPETLITDLTPGNDYGEFEILDLTIDAWREPTNLGIRVGRAGRKQSGLSWSKIDKLLLKSFTVAAFHFQNMRHVLISNSSIRSTGLTISNTEDEQFTGDLLFDNVEIVGTTSIRPISIFASAVSAASTPSRCRGIHFRDCPIYGAGTYLHTANDGVIGDLWFENCAFDPGGGSYPDSVIRIHAEDSGGMSQIFFDNTYVLGSATNIQKFVDINIAAGGFSDHIIFESGKFEGLLTGVAACISMSTHAEHISFRDNTFSRITTTSVFDISGDGTLINISDNDITNSTITNFVKTSNTIDYYTIKDNTGDDTAIVISDGSTGSNKTITNNNHLGSAVIPKTISASGAIEIGKHHDIGAGNYTLTIPISTDLTPGTKFSVSTQSSAGSILKTFNASTNLIYQGTSYAGTNLTIPAYTKLDCIVISQTRVAAS